MNNRKINSWFKQYEQMKENDYFLKCGVRADAIMVNSETEQKMEKKEHGITIVADDLIEKLSPNNIDSCYFWKKATEIFPLASVVYDPRCNDKQSLNESAVNGLHKEMCALNELDAVFEKNPNAKMLEIGPGHGSVTNYVALNHNIKNYYAIDVNPLFKFKRLYKTDGKTIPSKVPSDLDVVYSVNVFQHLTPEQRLSYYKQIKEMLVVGGKFIFSMFVVAPDTINLHFRDEKGGVRALFGIKDSFGNYYTSFFTQFTKCSKIEELETIFSELNMKFEIVHKWNNSFCMVATKL